MPEAPRVTGAVAQAAALAPRTGAVLSSGVPARVASVPSGATVILGINLSGPIVIEADPDEEIEQRGDSTRTALPSGEVSFPRVGRANPGAFPSTLTSLMTVTIVAFSLGLIVSPLGDAPASRDGRPAVASLASPPIAARVAAMVPPAAMVPLIVPTSLPASLPPAALPHAKAARSRASRVARSNEGAPIAWAPKQHGAGRKLFATASVRASDRSSDEEAAGGDRPSRKSIEKESVDLTKEGAPSVERDRKPAARPWVDPWAD
jgi:hypothetical protein